MLATDNHSRQFSRPSVCFGSLPPTISPDRCRDDQIILEAALSASVISIVEPGASIVSP
jgi:hypothetical protein